MNDNEHRGEMSVDSQAAVPDLRLVSAETAYECGWQRYCQELQLLSHRAIIEEHNQPVELECLRRNYVTVWLGMVSTTSAFDLYIGGEEYQWSWDVPWEEVSPCCTDLALSWTNLGLLRDYGLFVCRYSGAKLSVAELLQAMPWFRSFSDELLGRCQTLGIEHAQAGICIYDLDFYKQTAFLFGQLRCLGSFRFQR